MSNNAVTTMVIRRLLMMLLVVAGVTIITFTVSHLLPNDPAKIMGGPKADDETLADIRKKYGLDLPIGNQYVLYIRRLFSFDFGQSFSTHRPVFQDLEEFFPATAELVLCSLLIAVFGGITLGVIAATNIDGNFDKATNLLSMIGVSVPGFWLALLGQFLFYEYLGWLPIGGRLSNLVLPPPHITGFFTFDSLLNGDFSTFGDAAKHLLLPALIISIEPLCIVFRIMRVSFLNVINEQYIFAARARGVSNFRLYWHHAFKNALLPTIANIGLLIGYLMGGSILVESIFGWPGIGSYSAKALLASDFNSIMGVTIISVNIYLIANLLVDIVSIWLNPRAHS